MGSLVEVVGAVIVRDGLVLCARRGPGGAAAGRWEFPGGKVDDGETPTQALVREIDEELGCRITVGAEVTATPHRGIRLTTYWCTLSAGEPAATEHAELRWVRPDRLAALDWADADVPAVSIVAARAAASGATGA